MSNTTGLQQAVLDLIKKVYCSDYNHRIEVIHHEADKQNPSEYILHLYIHEQRLAPMCIAKQCDTDEEFLQYIEDELKRRNLIRSDFYKIELHDHK